GVSASRSLTREPRPPRSRTVRIRRYHTNAPPIPAIAAKATKKSSSGSKSHLPISWLPVGDWRLRMLHGLLCDWHGLDDHERDIIVHLRVADEGIERAEQLGGNVVRAAVAVLADDLPDTLFAELLLLRVARFPHAIGAE